MSGYFDDSRSAETVIDRIGPATDPRLRRIMSSLITHLHGFIKDAELTEREWEQAIDFLTRTGQLCSGTRQEFILLSDTLGVSMLVDAINHRAPAPATQSTVFGPFHVDGAPERQAGESISLDGKGELCLFRGRVLDTDGNPVANALIDVWSDNADGFYDVQQPDVQPPFNNRGLFRTDAEGRYAFRGIRPVSYPIPYDGPVGQMLTALGRHPWRPAHMHFLITAPGFERLITHIFVAGDQYLTSDAVFGVKETLIVDFKPVDSPTERWLADYDFVLVRQSR
ncbi:hydroxyquinol 1,2-dioxygenase (plasmid) [Azospirillum sp. B510]|uniref:intradiol ring-cleavage dioxygenase n=1 Tax=Azospirillum sp. (strain B510) TaxID=137722 RepID=UPI0001C4BBB5|nr:intradiol ring-cleavage dioxygenase [Azospirillum sp. B510]BAI74424.1 hydroxyquinol 1,2-dioxygenase [Azospirillum sp. B510]